MIAQKKENRAPEVIPTNTCPKDLQEMVRRSEAFSAFAPVVHLDVSDNKFAPTQSWPFFEGQWAELDGMGVGATKLPLAGAGLQYEVHLMIESPLSLGVAFARAGATRIIAHVESFTHADSARDAIRMWRLSGAREVGLAILMDTSLDALAPYASLCDEILVMTIASIGKQGIPFDERGITRVRELAHVYPQLVIAVDGVVSPENITLLREAGASRFCVGSSIEKQADPPSAYRELLALASS
jgi:ribulose-phosphate 3-epimerase